MLFQKSKPITRAPFICSGFLLSLSIVLMAFHYGVPSEKKKKLPEWDKDEVLVPQMQQAPEKPEPQGQEAKKKKRATHSSLAEEVNKKSEKGMSREQPDPEDLEIGSMGREGEEPKMDIPEYVPQGPVAEHKLSHYALFPGCEDQDGPEEERACTSDRLKAFIQEHAEYPQMLREQGIDGKAYATFVIDKKGQVRDIKVVQSDHPKLGSSLKKALRKLPRFVPARMQGHKVSIRHSMPVSYMLN